MGAKHWLVYKGKNRLRVVQSRVIGNIYNQNGHDRGLVKTA
jgi:hypothetical protein